MTSLRKDVTGGTRGKKVDSRELRVCSRKFTSDLCGGKSTQGKLKRIQGIGVTELQDK